MPIGALLGAVAPILPSIFNGISKIKSTKKNSTDYGAIELEKMRMQQQNNSTLLQQIQSQKNNSSSSNEMLKYAVPVAIALPILFVILKK